MVPVDMATIVTIYTHESLSDKVDLEVVNNRRRPRRQRPQRHPKRNWRIS
jgi:hypothetical protein